MTGRDGLSAISFPTNVANTPIEIKEVLTPLRIHRRELRPAPGGGGGRFGGAPRPRSQRRHSKPA